MRGPGAVTRLGFIDNVEIRALCDLYPSGSRGEPADTRKAGMPRADAYTAAGRVETALRAQRPRQVPSSRAVAAT